METLEPSNPFWIWEMEEIILCSSGVTSSHLIMRFIEILNRCLDMGPQFRFRLLRCVYYYVGSFD